MDFKRVRVLVTDGSGKQPLTMIYGLKKIGCFVSVLCSSKIDTCYVSNQPDEKILDKCFKKRDEETFKKWMILVKTNNYDVIMPVGEDSTNLATKHERELSNYVKIACAPRNVYIKAFNKQITFEQALCSGVPCPYTRFSNQPIEIFLNKAKFPVIIKPRQGLGSIGFHKFNTKEEFVERLKNDCLFNVDDYVIQEFVNFEHRIDANIFMDRNGDVCTSYSADVLRWFPIDAGAGVLLKTINEPEAIKNAVLLLHDLGWQGFANVNFMIEKDTGKLKLLEINGRIPASVKLAFMCGFNISQQLLELVYDEEIIKYPENKQFGKYLRHLDTDIAWFIKSPERFRAQPSWFSWKNTEEVLFYKNDIKPFFAQFLQKLLSYKKIMKEKAH